MTSMAEQFRRDLAHHATDPKWAATEMKWRTTARTVVALCNVYIAKTLDARSAERRDRLQAAAKVFETIYHASPRTPVALIAHAARGRVAEELKDLELAADVYDEVLAGMPEATGGNRDSGLPAPFAVALQGRLMLKAASSQNDFLRDAAAFRSTYRARRQSPDIRDAYQAVSFVYAAAMTNVRGKLQGKEQENSVKEADRALADLLTDDCPYQAQACRLRQRLLGGEPDTFAQAYGLGLAAAAEAKWSDAAGDFEKALEIAKRPGSTVSSEQLSNARERLAAAWLMLACDWFSKGELAKCRDTLRQIVEKCRDTAAGQSAFRLGVVAESANCRQRFERSGKADFEDDLARLSRVAEDTLKLLPDTPAADEARVALAFAQIVRDKIADVRWPPRPARPPVPAVPAWPLAGGLGALAAIQRRACETGRGPESSANDRRPRSGPQVPSRLCEMPRPSVMRPPAAD